MVKENKKVSLGKSVVVKAKDRCDRCGNDLVKGGSWLHFPYMKLHIVLCHVCLDGLMYGFYKDVRQQLKYYE